MSISILLAGALSGFPARLDADPLPLGAIMLVTEAIAEEGDLVMVAELRRTNPWVPVVLLEADQARPRLRAVLPLAAGGGGVSAVRAR